MYALPPACHCSCFAVSNKEHILFGRNSDFLTGLEGDCSNMLYRFPRESNSYSFMGDTTSFIQMEDGVNKAGLAVGLASIYPPSIQPGMNAGMLLRIFSWRSAPPSKRCWNGRQGCPSLRRRLLPLLTERERSPSWSASPEG